MGDRHGIAGWPAEWFGITPVNPPIDSGRVLPVDTIEDIESVIAAQVTALSSDDAEARALAINTLIDVYLERRALRRYFNKIITDKGNGEAT